MPRNYRSDYTGPEIDDAVGRKVAINPEVEFDTPTINGLKIGLEEYRLETANGLKLVTAGGETKLYLTWNNTTFGNGIVMPSGEGGEICTYDEENEMLVFTKA